MTTLAPVKPQEAAGTFMPRILVFSTNNISDPGIDLAGSSHMHYSPDVVVISLPCTSGISPCWILHAIEQGFDGVFIAADGDECAYLSDCSARASRIIGQAQTLLQGARLLAAAPEDGRHLLGVRRAVHAATCSEFGEALAALGPSVASHHDRLRRPGRGRRHRRHGVGPQARRHGLQGPAGREGGQRRRQDDPAQQGLPDPRLRELHLDAQDGRDDPPPQRHRHDVQRGRRASAQRRRRPSTRPSAQKPTFVDEAALHGLSPVRDGLHRGRARPVQRRHGVAPGGLHRVSAGGAQEGRHRARRHLALHVHVPGRHQGARLRVAHPQRRVREGIPARPRCHAAGRHASAAPATRPAKSECTRGDARGSAPDPSPQALHRRPATTSSTTDPGSAIPAPNGKRVAVVGSGPGRPHRRLAARAQGLRGQDLRGRAAGRRLPPPGHPRVPAARTRSSTQDIANVTALGVEIATSAPVDDLGAAARRTATTPCCVATGTPLSTSLGVPGDELDGVLSGARLPARRQARRGRRPERPQACRRRRRRQRRHGRRPHRPPARRRATSPSSTAAAATEMPAHDCRGRRRRGRGHRVRLQRRRSRCSTTATARSAAGDAAAGLHRPCLDHERPVAARVRSTGSDFDVACDVVIVAVGMAADTEASDLETDGSRLAVDPETLQTRRAVRSSPPATWSSGASDDHARRRPGPARRLHDRPLSAGPASSTPALRRAGSRSSTRPRSSRRQDVYTRRDAARRRAPSLSAAPIDFAEIELPMTEDEALRGAGPLPRLRRLLRVPTPASTPARPIAHRPRHARTQMLEVDVGAVVRGHRLQALPGRPQAGVRLRASTRTSSPACRWTACWRRPGPSTPCCVPATARCPSASPTSCAPARATRRSATRSARRSAACTRSSRTS